jgi:deoxyribodipyrimidine photo-lyase
MGAGFMTTIMWFRQDLRLVDNPALVHAAKRGDVVPVYIDEEGTGVRPLGSAAKWWLHYSLEGLKKSLGGLVILRGDPAGLLPALVERVKATAVVWNRCYDPHGIRRDTVLKKLLLDQGVEAQSFNGSLLFEPWELKTGAGGPFKVFTPFWRACLRQAVVSPVVMPKFKCVIADGGIGFENLALLPVWPDWAAGFGKHWTPGEAGARLRLAEFLDEGLRGYA